MEQAKNEKSEGTGGFGKQSRARTSEEDAALEARSKILWSVDMSILRERGSEYWKRWRESYYEFKYSVDEANHPWPEIKAMQDEELKKYMNDNCYKEW